LDISIIIVNYNVEYFLEQCLNSCIKALQNVDGEIIVVDNNSIDGSNEMVKNKFPSVQLIENKINFGFSKANNQGIKIAKGKHILLLNPDTVVEEDTFEKVINFMNQNENVGGLGVRMLDGKGKFLPESKRGLPTPMVAFFKIFGFSSLFPKSKLFGKYHLGFLSEFKTHKVDVLSGAFMLLRKKALDKIGLLDETFFMYGEDIDLSYRITLGGYDNYYYPETRIIHYKGESTKKSSINYVFVFYKAMVIFAQKHFSKNNAALFSFFINIAIYFRAGLAILSRFIRNSALIVTDFFIISFGLKLLTNYWTQNGIEFPNYVLLISIPIYSFVWIISNFYSGIYDFPIKLNKTILGTILGTILILLVYGLLPKSFQFSRLFILIGTLWTIVYYSISRFYLHFSIKNKFRLNTKLNSNFIIIGDEIESERVKNVLKQINSNLDQLFVVSSNNEKSKNTIGILSQLDQLIQKYKVDEVIFCAKNVSAQEIINWMSLLENYNVDFKIAQPDSVFLIGSNSIDTAGDLYILNINEISKKSNLRIKRTLDLFLAFLFLCFSPILIFYYQRKLIFLKNMFHCLFGKKSLVGYFFNVKNQESNLPYLKKGILTPLDILKSKDESLSGKINLIYARDYHILKDLKIIKQAWKNLDRNLDRN
jgi:GT2 family glycosyltransferase